MLYQNENILGLIFKSLTLFQSKQLFDQIKNTSICNIILNFLSYKKMFISMGKTEIVLEHHYTDSLTLLPKNNMFITISEYYTLRLWDISKASCISIIEDDHHLTTAIELPNNNIAIGTIEDVIQIRSITNDINCIKTVHLNHYKGIENFCILSNGKLAGSSYGTSGYYILLFDLENEFNLVKVINCHNWPITTLINLSNNRFATGSRDYTIKVWSVSENYAELKTLTQHEDVIRALVYLDKGDILTSASYDKIIKFFDLNDY
jgi:WD40 repeat protein